ncbi:preprotein translocase subunit YajC [Thioclava sp. GXIMD4216]|uniref:Sec translocon accessory complex subunit YajC n=1 Tax=Thioclava litoralis TaxID=3076557 RepID=A0ABZ1E058_9RHOB|nr:preprotein translocase subunit YajC [Thioclava sp. FTW29]
MFVTPAYAQAAGAAAPGGMAALGQFLPLILIFIIMYFLLIRPQQKKAKQHRQMVEALRRGDEVVTQGGILGKVTNVREDGMVEVEIAQGVKVRVVKSTIGQVVSKTEPAAESK